MTSPYYTHFTWPYFGAVRHYSHTVGHAGSTTGNVYADITLTQSKVKVKVTGLRKLRQLPKIALLYVYLLRDFGMELKLDA